MAWFRRKEPVAVKTVHGEHRVVERKTKKVGRSTVEVRRVIEQPRSKPKPQGKKQPQKGRGQRPDRRSGGSRQSNNGRPRRVELPPLPAPDDSVKKQMLVRVRPNQTQVVVLEGPTLVEHHVAAEETRSLAGNIYLAVVRNVLPGMEAAFLDFGESKNGVLYASDVKADPAVHGRSPRIEDVLKNGDHILVQVVKDAMGSKGARLTAEVSMAGRYLVLVPASDVMGISRRLPDEERRRLRDVVKEARPKGFGVIVRTAANGASEAELAKDIEHLAAQWETVTKAAEGGPAPRVIHEEPELLLRVIREHFTSEYRRLLIDDERAAERVREYLRATAPDLIGKVKVYEDELGLFERFHVEDQLRKALDRKVYLKSGGHLVIDRTEALTVIDVNTGKFVGKSSLEETVLFNNLEAAEEIGRQLRLRDIGGIIVIDFIDMESEKNQRMLLQKFRETLARDKTRTQVYDVSALGLVEMTRKNVSKSLLENFSEACPHCQGRGIILDEEAALRGARFQSEELHDAD